MIAEKIKKSELGKMLKVSERVIDMHVQNKILPVPSYPTYPETEMLFDRAAIARALNIKEIPNEPFIDADEVAEILGLEEKTIHHYARTGKLPSYRLKSIRGHRFLFLRSEIVTVLDYSAEWNHNFVNFFFKQFFLRAIFDELLTKEITKDFTQNEVCVMKDVMINKKSLAQIAVKLGLSESRTQQIFQRACKRVYFRIKQISSLANSMDALIKENAELRSENKILKKLNIQNKSIEEKDFSVLKIKVSDIDMSNRIRGIFNRSDIITIGDVMKYSWNDFLKFRNLGVNSLKEIELILAKYNLKLNR